MTDAEVTRALCGLLGALSGWKYDEDPGTGYDETDVRVTYGSVQDWPDQGVGVRVYDGDDPENLTVRRAQLRFRGNRDRPDGADELADAAFAQLHGLVRVAGINTLTRISFGPLGADVNGREERTDNYEVILDNTEA